MCRPRERYASFEFTTYVYCKWTVWCNDFGNCSGEFDGLNTRFVTYLEAGDLDIPIHFLLQI